MIFVEQLPLIDCNHWLQYEDDMSRNIAPRGSSPFGPFYHTRLLNFIKIVINFENTWISMMFGTPLPLIDCNHWLKYEDDVLRNMAPRGRSPF